MQIIISPSNDPLANLATEKTLLTERLTDVLFLYINTPCVVLGRNQSAEAEADIEFCQENNIPIIARISGGGAVFHDEGNINFSFITNTVGNNLVLDTDFLTPIVASLQQLGIEATIGKRKELLYGDKKISGTASHITKGGQIFHGTLLYNTNLEMLNLALMGNPTARGSKVASVQAP